jgi:hypothetical protein
MSALSQPISRSLLDSLEVVSGPLHAHWLTHCVYARARLCVCVCVYACVRACGRPSL